MLYTLEKIDVSFEIVGETVLISSKFADKDEVKAWGAKWHPAEKKWMLTLEIFCIMFQQLHAKYIFDNAVPPVFTIQKGTYTHKEKPLIFKEVENDGERTIDVLQAPFEYKDELKDFGFWKNTEKKCWYYPDVDVFYFMFSDSIIDVSTEESEIIYFDLDVV